MSAKRQHPEAVRPPPEMESAPQQPNTSLDQSACSQMMQQLYLHQQEVISFCRDFDRLKDQAAEPFIRRAVTTIASLEDLVHQAAQRI